MKYGLTIVYITARREPKVGWFLHSLGNQIKQGEDVRVIIVDFFNRHDQLYADWIKVVEPKPCVWQGPHRLTTTEQHWFTNANARNTGICLCETPWIALLDDRCVLGPEWLQSIRHAMDDNYIVCGSYEKVFDLDVKDGVAVSWKEHVDGNGLNIGADPRLVYLRKRNIQTPYQCGGEWLYGCTLAMPLEWALSVNGYDETCDGLGMEDTTFGMFLQNSGYPVVYDRRMSIIEDRTPGQLEPVMKREDKGPHPTNKSHALLAMLKDRKTAMHGFDIREVRRNVLAGKGWPKPWGPTHDFWDGERLEDMT